ncbi:MAG: ABC transporter substrate-binding protein [Clostridia bacterium]|nr:ABC transporter substrate-binding protein [Clostridia bacterium]MBO7156759.1 ABC transporter substrate-binding protein [Clostridia bacterium]
MNKVLSILLVCILAGALVISGVIGCSFAEEPEETLVVYNWGDYIDEDVEGDFEEYYFSVTGKRIDLVYSTFETNEIMLTTVEKGEEAIDLVCPSEYAIQKLMEGGYLQKLDYSKISTYSNIEAEIYHKVDLVFTDMVVEGEAEHQKMSDYFVPYMWGTLGILYNTDYVTEADLEKGYGLLWNEAGNPDIDSKILMKDSIRDSYVAAVMYLKEEGRLPAGYENIPVQKLINTVDENMLRAVEEILLEQADVLKGYEVDFGKAQMTSERAYVDLAWSGDALWAMEDADNLNYFVPESGGNVWFDGWCLLKSSQNPSAAYMFIEYLCRPDIAMRNAMAIGYTSGVSKAALMADEDAISILTENEYDVEEYFGDELRYPEISADNLGVMKDFGVNNSATIEMWERVKSSKQNSMWILWVAIAAVAGGLIAFGAYYFMNNRSRQFVRLVKTREELEAEEQEISK